MKAEKLHSLFRVARIASLGLVLAAQGLAGLRGGPGSFGYRNGYGYGYRPYYGRGFYRPGPGCVRAPLGLGPAPVLPVLPGPYVTFYWGPAPWYLCGGAWYRSYGAGYVADFPPAGILVTALPPGCVSSSYGGITYYSADGVYYTAAPSGTGYVVAAPPPGQAPAGSPDAVALDALVIIPREGQTEEKALADRRDALAYAQRQSGYDPAQSDPGDPGTPRARQRYLKAMKDYLEGRGYTVK